MRTAAMITVVCAIQCLMLDPGTASAQNAGKSWVVELIAGGGRVAASKGPYSNYSEAVEVSNRWQKSLAADDYRLTRVRELNAAAATPNQIDQIAANVITEINDTLRKTTDSARVSGMGIPVTGNTTLGYADGAARAYDNAKALADRQQAFNKNATNDLFDRLDQIVKDRMAAQIAARDAVAQEMDRIRTEAKGSDYPLRPPLLPYRESYHAGREGSADEDSADHPLPQLGSRRPTTDQANLHPQAEQIIARRKEEKRLRDLGDQINALQSKINGAGRQIRKLQMDIADWEQARDKPDVLMTLRLNNRKGDLERAQRAYDQELHEWRTRRNPRCDTSLTYDECSCQSGALSKRFKLEAIDRAKAARDRALKAYNDANDAIATHQASRVKDRKAKIAEAQRQLKSLQQRQASDQQTLAGLQAELATSEAELDSVEPTQPLQPAGKIILDDSIPRRNQPPLKLDAFPR